MKTVKVRLKEIYKFVYKAELYHKMWKAHDVVTKAGIKLYRGGGGEYSRIHVRT
jgi:hypothetical protein